MALLRCEPGCSKLYNCTAKLMSARSSLSPSVKSNWLYARLNAEIEFTPKAHLHFWHRLTTSIADSRDDFSRSRSMFSWRRQPTSVAGENGTVNIRTTSLALFRRWRQLVIIHPVRLHIPWRVATKMAFYYHDEEESGSSTSTMPPFVSIVSSFVIWRAINVAGVQLCPNRKFWRATLRFTFDLHARHCDVTVY
jgi:hypothetical protein